MTRAAPPTCCGKPCELTTGKHLFPTNKETAARPYWACQECGAYVGCKSGSTRPIGILCGPELQRARELLEAQRIKPLWENAPWAADYQVDTGLEVHRIRNTARKRVFDYLADRLRIPRDRCRLEFFDLETCRRAWRALTDVTYPEIREWSHDAPVTEETRAHGAVQPGRDPSSENYRGDKATADSSGRSNLQHEAA